jgi:hypothetical protein
MCLVSERYTSDWRYLKSPEFRGTFKTFSGLVGNHDGRLPPDMLSADCEDINKGVLTGCRVSDPVPLRSTSQRTSILRRLSSPLPVRRLFLQKFMEYFFFQWFRVLAVVILKITVVLDVTPCSVVDFLLTFV